MPSADDRFPHFFELCPKTLGDGLATYGETIALLGPTADVREPEKVERFRLSLPPLGTVCFRKSSELDESSLLPMDFQSVLIESFLHFSQESFCLSPVLKPHNEVSNAEELPLCVLAEPGVNLSAHRAPIIQPSV